jgi:hypothetical protein
MECDPISSGLRNRVYLAARCANRRMTRMGELSQRERPRHHPPSPPFGGLLHYRWGSHHGLTQKAAMETSTVSCWSKAFVRRQHPHCAERLMMVGILWATMLGCSQDGSSITTVAPCAAPIIEPSESTLGLVGPHNVSTSGNGSWVTLKWDANSNTLGYRLYIGTRSQNYQQVADVGLLTTSIVSNLASNRTYHFAVTAYKSAGESCPSNEVSIRIP